MQARNHIPLNDGQIQEAARLFATLSEPSRLRLLQALMGGPMTVTELVEATDMRQGNVSKQLGSFMMRVWLHAIVRAISSAMPLGTR